MTSQNEHVCWMSPWVGMDRRTTCCNDMRGGRSALVRKHHKLGHGKRIKAIG